LRIGLPSLLLGFVTIASSFFPLPRRLLRLAVALTSIVLFVRLQLLGFRLARLARPAAPRLLGRWLLWRLRERGAFHAESNAQSENRFPGRFVAFLFEIANSAELEAGAVGKLLQRQSGLFS
jgi:hypothetical protein